MYRIKKSFVPIFVIVMVILLGNDCVNAKDSNRTKGEEELKRIDADDYYTEKYRPQYHFSTETGRLADPNGLVYFESEYHLFHQKMGTWAHAVSKDLVHWEHLPIALEHDELGQALSGSAVVDWNDSTGFFNGKPGLVAIYTNTDGGEAQSIAYSKDNGRTWERYKGNPVIENPGMKDFRDPKVFWHEESKKWVMVVSTNQSVTFYNSDNLLDWEYQSRFGDREGSHVAVWECPDLFRLPVDGNEDNQKWVLHVSVGDNPVTDGSTAQYFIGEFDGKQFVNDNPPESVLVTDFGQDYYAAQSFANIPEEDGRRVWLGWMANWRYPYQSPTEPWMGSMSIPRELSLKTTEDGIRLFQEPIRELKSIRATEYSVDAFTLEGEREISDFAGTTYEFEAVVEWDQVNEFGIRLRQSETEETVVGVNTDTETVFLDRTNAGLETLIDRDGKLFQFGKRFETNFSKDRKQLKIHGFVDESSVELFVNDGEYVFTNLIYTKPTNKGIELYTKGGRVDIVSLDFYHLHSIWRETPDDGEIDRMAVSEENVELEVGESIELTAHAKPDWLSVTEPFVWEVAQSDLIQIDDIDEKKVKITGVQLGVTTVTVRDPNRHKSKEIIVRILEDKDSDYIDGWGPSPITGAFSGKWDIIDDESVTSRVEYSPDWKEIYRDEVVTGDFSVSADIEWVKQGKEGFPKYGITIMDEKGTIVSAFFNKDIHQLETFMKYSDRELGWEGADLPTNVKLYEPQTLKVEKTGDVFRFYLNGERMLERVIEMNGNISVGVINENTKANFTNYTIADENTPPVNNAADLKEMIERFGEDGEFSNDSAHALKIHLTAVGHYEDKGMAKKVVKHMERFKLLLDHQHENAWISERAYTILTKNADLIIAKWE
ncbi:glycoside hydrolase family 32 protein [Lederbergia sp. NSJ-179]|uniref:glycoside hydrolase family 32 protein n=1 Tax=Lederbergia sp. NSJ-179 TaxID=2931402 RepID=UPI001FD4FF4F|nr:glycoside hydrolase family 32 protein [Lederbergia sp. NSJ-179]MCJ7842277.1 glycoside hydrolase family 32 protein [Lederbergia sp. NSJ-179]